MYIRGCSRSLQTKPELTNINLFLDNIVSTNNVGIIGANIKSRWLIRKSLLNFDTMENFFKTFDLSESGSTQNYLHRSSSLECTLVLVKAMQITCKHYVPALHCSFHDLWSELNFANYFGKWFKYVLFNQATKITLENFLVLAIAPYGFQMDSILQF